VFGEQANRQENDQWKSAYAWFERAMELPAGERLTFSQEAIQDPEVLRLVLDLLESEKRDEATQPEGARQPHPGEHYGRFALGELLGRGGMGEVYSARDTELNRAVAIKFLSPQSFGSSGTVERLIREARAASALNHPGIVIVHEVIRSEDSLAIVMERVDGMALRNLCGKPNAAAEVARLGSQIAEALAAAHAGGVVHRDIKPENVMVRPDGYLKVLDFGAAAQIGTGEDLAGIPIGTLGYMSPEQIQGKPLTGASDVFSLGVVLTELASGRHPFLQDTAALTSRAIQTSEPGWVTANECKIAEPLGSLLRSMLAKEPGQRPDGAAVALELARIARRNENRVQRLALRVVLPFLVVGAVGTAWWETHRPQPDRPPVVKQYTTLDGSELQPSFSPDGRKIAFSGDGTDGVSRNIYVQNVDGDTAARLTTHPAQDSNPVWSPDGQQIAFLRKSPADSSQLVMVMAAQGGEEREVGRIEEFEHFYAPLAWWPDGGSLIVREQSKGTVGFLRLMLPTGEKRPLTMPTGTSRDSNAAVSPDGRRFAFIRRDGSALDNICFAPLEDKKEGIDIAECVLKANDIREIAWWHGGKEILYTWHNAIWRISAGANAARSQAKVIDGAFHDLAADRQGRRLAASMATSDPNLWRVGRNGEGRVKLIASSKAESDADYSPDGERIVFRSSRSGNLELWVAGKDGSQWTRLTNFGGFLGSARWSPDGREIAFDGHHPSFEYTKNTNIYIVSAAGGPIRRLTDDQAIYGVPNWSHDGRWVYFCKSLGSRREAWKIPAEGGTPVLVSGGMMFDVAESADGQYLYYTTQLGAGGIWRRRVEGGEPSLLPGTEGVQKYRYWQLTPQGIYFVEGPANPVVQFLDLKTGHVTRLASLSPQLLGARGLSVSPDGKFFLYLQEDAKLSNLYLIESVQ